MQIVYIDIYDVLFDLYTQLKHDFANAIQISQRKGFRLHVTVPLSQDGSLSILKWIKFCLSLYPWMV